MTPNSDDTQVGIAGGDGPKAVPAGVVAAAKRVQRLNRAHTCRNGFSEPGNDVRMIVNHILKGAAR